MPARTPQQIALSRALETLISTGIVGAVVSTVTALILTLQQCVPPPMPLPPGDAVFLGCTIGLRMILLTFVIAAGTGVVNYITALVSANKNVAVTGTTAPVSTAAAPETPGGIISALIK